LLRLTVSMRTARQMVLSVPASTNVEAYMTMEDGLCHTVQTYIAKFSRRTTHQVLISTT
jgi:hypothetical protein